MLLDRLADTLESIGADFLAKVTLDDLRTLAGFAASGAFRPFIDRAYPLECVAEAHACVDGGHKRGSVVLTMAGRSLAS